MAKAQKGDLIRIIVASDTNVVGCIYEVTATSDDIAYVEGCLEYSGFAHSNYVIHRKAGEEDSPKTSTDAVNPQHYKQGRTEVIDIIEDAVVGADPFEAVCQANVLKYTLRYRHKNGVEDLKKAMWYAEKLIEHLTQK